MPNWITAAEARDELRAFLNDGPVDRPVKSKIVIGVVDGVNKIYYTFDDRVVSGTLVPTIDGVDQSAFTLDDPILGKFTFTTAPVAQSTVRARYYYQFFLDSELDEFLRMAAGQIRETDDITTVIPGLKNAALNFAGHFAFAKQAIRWAQRMSERFILEDAPVEGEPQARSNLFKSLSQMYYDTAVKMREDYYKRHGRREAPAFNVYKPRIPSIAPRR